MFKKTAFLAATALLAVSSIGSTDAWMNAQAVDNYSHSVVTVGTDEPANIKVAAGVSHTETISYPNAEYIAVRFDSFNLPEGDEVIVHSPDHSVSYTYTGKGRNNAGAFYATFIPGDHAIVEYISKNKEVSSDKPAFTIPVFARGHEQVKVESVCGADQTVPAKCYQNNTELGATIPKAYERAQAVARLLINGTSLCTGWLAGSEGHLITNQHCIEEPELAGVIDYEFAAESATCADQCQTQLGCKGTVVATSAEFVTLSSIDNGHDYAMVKLPQSEELKKYGYLQFRGAGPKLNEEIYIPQHPQGYPKRIAAVVDSGAAAIIEELGATTSCGSNQVGYTADTAGGASGSPVLSKTDNLVIALHHCGGCRNTAVNIVDVIADLKAKNIVVKDLIVDSSSEPTPSPSSTSPAPTSTPAPTTQTPAPTTKTPAPTTKTPAPTTKTPAPTTKTPAPTTPAPSTCGDLSYSQCYDSDNCYWDWWSGSCINF